jgi:hypothetical protein
MMFALVRAGLPNSVAVLALAIVPVVSLAVWALPERTDLASYRNLSLTLVTAIDTVADSIQVIEE